MAAKKTSAGASWKLKAIDALIAQQEVILTKLHPIRQRQERDAAHARLKKLKAQRRTPATLLTLRRTLFDHAKHHADPANNGKLSGLDRLRKFPKGSEKILVAIDHETQRIILEADERDRAQREKAARPRPGKAGGDIKAALIEDAISKLAKTHPEPDEGPSSLWPQLQDELYDTFRAAEGTCDYDEDADVYNYSFAAAGDDGNTIIYRGELTYSKFCKILRKIRTA